MSDAAESTTESAPPRETYGTPRRPPSACARCWRGCPTTSRARRRRPLPVSRPTSSRPTRTPTARCRRCSPPSATGATTINRYPDMAVTALTERLAEGARRARRVHRDGHRLGRRARADRGRGVRRRRRGRLRRGARSRPTPSSRSSPAPSPSWCGLDEQARTASARCPPRSPTAPASSSSAPPTTRPAPASARPSSRRSSTRCRATSSSSSTRPTSSSCATPRRCAASRCGATAPTSSCCAPSPRPTGSPGLRVGYAVAHPPVAAALRKTATPFGVNSHRAGRGDRVARRLRRAVRAGGVPCRRARSGRAGPRRPGLEAAPIDANFVWFPLGSDSTAFSEACQEAGLMVRQYGDDGVRVTIGEAEANTRLLEVAEAFGAR